MWSSLWDIYSGETADAGKPRAAPERSPPRQGVTGTRRGTPRAGVASPSRGSHDGRGAGDRTITLQTSLHSTSSGSSAGKRQATTPPQSSGNTTILRGVIVGEEKSGKTCLIRRLRGEDPFQDARQRRLDGIERTKTDRPGRRSLMALIPWALPKEAPFHKTHPSPEPEEPVQLYVSEAKSFFYQNEERPFQKQWTTALQPHRGKACNFVIWVVDPRMKNVLEYLRLGLDILIPSATQHDNAKDEEADSQNAKPPLAQHVCILLNFRDLINPAKPEEDKSSLGDDVQRMAERAVERCQKDNANDSGEPGPTPTILVYESSMKNCYGLQNLHSFIALPYADQRERELRRRADNARKQQLQWKRGLMAATVVQYSEFVEQQKKEQHHPQTQESLGRQRLEEEKQKLELRLKHQNELLRAKGVPTVSAEEKKQTASAHAAPSDRSMTESKEEKALPSASKREQRKLFAKSDRKSNHQSVTVKAAPAPAIKEHHNLESFFSDDETESVAEDDSESSYGDDDDSDDGDFFIDVSGTRSTPNHQKISKRSSSKPKSKSPEEKTEATGRKDKVDDSISEDSVDESVAEQNEQSNATPDGTVQSAEDEQTAPAGDGSAGDEAKSGDQPEEQSDGASQNVIAEQTAADEVEPNKSKGATANDSETKQPNDEADSGTEAEEASKQDRVEEDLVEPTSSEEAAGDGGASLDEGADKAAAEPAPKQKIAKNGTKVHVVMDSDDESVAPQKEDTAGIEEEGAGSSEKKFDPTQQSALPPKPTTPAQNGTAITPTAAVSTAALAAIEAAKREAEQMMAQSLEVKAPSSKKKSKKEKRKRKKREKKERDDY